MYFRFKFTFSLFLFINKSNWTPDVDVTPKKSQRSDSENKIKRRTVRENELNRGKCTKLTWRIDRIEMGPVTEIVFFCKLSFYTFYIFTITVHIWSYLETKTYYYGFNPTKHNYSNVLWSGSIPNMICDFESNSFHNWSPLVCHKSGTLLGMIPFHFQRNNFGD